MINVLPKELMELKQWSYSYSPTQLKRPTHSKYKPDGALSYEEAKANTNGTSKYVGFYTTSSDPYILGDIDHLNNPYNPFEELPVPLASLLMSANTYCEVSPSGNGLRFILKLADVSIKKDVKGSVFYIKEGMESKREAQISFGPPWNTITCNVTPFSMPQVSEVSLEELQEVFHIHLKKVVDDTKPEIRAEDLPGISELTWALESVPLDQNPRVKRAYQKVFDAKYQHYDFWIKVLMGLHNYGELSGSQAKCMNLATKWSQQDPSSYESDDDIVQHWRSFSEEDKTPISYKTIFGLAYACNLIWPRPKKQTKKEKQRNMPRLPMITEYMNFKRMIDFYNIRVYRDSGNPNMLYLTGDRDIIKKYFKMNEISELYGMYYGVFTKDTLTPALHIMSQELGFIGVSHAVINGFVKNLLAETRNTLDLVKHYFETPFDQLPDKYQEGKEYQKATLYDLFECLEIDFMTKDTDAELNLYFKYYKVWFMGLVKSIWYKDLQHMHSCVLLLTGREQIRKTSHFQFLLPEFMRDQVAFTTHGFSNEAAMRDVTKLSATNLILVWDELEQYLVSGTESNFKKIIDGNKQKIIDKYETIEKVVQPIAIYGATSNQHQFNLGQEGSRRIFHIPVKWVDTDKMREVCWHTIINQLRAEFGEKLQRQDYPWMLDEQELKYQNQLHQRIISKNSIDIILDEVFNTDALMSDYVIHSLQIYKLTNKFQTDDTGLFMTTKEVKDTIEKAGYSLAGAKEAAVVRALERLCANYTGTKNKTRTLMKPKCLIIRGKGEQGPYKKWCLPPIRQEVKEKMFQQFKPYKIDKE